LKVGVIQNFDFKLTQPFGNLIEISTSKTEISELQPDTWIEGFAAVVPMAADGGASSSSDWASSRRAWMSLPLIGAGKTGMPGV